MRRWAADHPRARLLARKQGAILDAARREFLKHGFGNTTMAGVASSAGVSIATLYRHARTKDELFDEVVRLRGDPEQLAAGLAHLATLPLDEAMVLMGKGFLMLLLSPDVLAMHRMVIAEAERFPHLGQVAFDAVFGHVAETLTGFLTPRLGEAEAGRIAPHFLSQVVADRQVRALLGLPPESEAELDARVRALVALVMAKKP